MQTHLATLLSVSLLGRLVIMNCVDSVANGAISRDLADEFIREWAKRCADVTNPAEIFGKLRILRETDPRFRAATGRAGLLGAEEAVVPDFRPQTPRMTFLGYPRAPRNDFPGVNDDQFVANIQRRRNSSTLLNKFLEICA